MVLLPISTLAAVVWLLLLLRCLCGCHCHCCTAAGACLLKRRHACCTLRRRVLLLHLSHVPITKFCRHHRACPPRRKRQRRAHRAGAAGGVAGPWVASPSAGWDSCRAAAHNGGQFVQHCFLLAWCVSTVTAWRRSASSLQPGVSSGWLPTPALSTQWLCTAPAGWPQVERQYTAAEFIERRALEVELQADEDEERKRKREVRRASA